MNAWCPLWLMSTKNTILVICIYFIRNVTSVATHLFCNFISINICFALEIQIARIAQEYSNGADNSESISKHWLSRRYLAWEQSSFGIWIFSHMTESHHFILQGYSNNLYFHIFLSIWLCNKADLGLVQDTQKIVVVALVNEKMECHILGWISFWSPIIFFTIRISSILFYCKNILQISRSNVLIWIRLHFQR